MWIVSTGSLLLHKKSPAKVYLYYSFGPFTILNEYQFFLLISWFYKFFWIILVRLLFSRRCGFSRKLHFKLPRVGEVYIIHTLVWLAALGFGIFWLLTRDKSYAWICQDVLVSLWIYPYVFIFWSFVLTMGLQLPLWSVGFGFMNI